MRRRSSAAPFLGPALALAPTLALFLPAPALGDEIATGTVIAVEEREIYINFGAGRGLTAGAPLRLKRPVSLRHPVTRARVTDWVPLGSARVTAVGKQLSMAVLEPRLLAQIKVGDRAEVYVVGAEPAPKPQPQPASTRPAEPLPEVPPDTRELLALWQRLSGAGLDARITAWERFLAAHPRSRHAPAIREDVAALRELAEAMRSPDDTVESPALGGVRHAAPTRAEAGRAVPLAFLIEDPGRLSTAWLHYRRRGEASYRRVRLEREGDSYLRGQVPASAVAAPGLEYFVEIATAGGETGTAVGDPARPIQVAVERPSIASAFAGEPRRSRVTLRGSYLDFATFDDRGGSRVDRYVLLEAEISYRIGKLVHAVRTGFGSAQGQGGFADRIYPDPDDAPEVGFHYGFAEVELSPHRHLGFVLRAVSGVGQEGLGVGGEARVRVGDPDRTNISLGASRIDELGFFSDLRLQVEALPRAPLGFTVAVTDQPNEGDLGMLFAADLGWRALDWLTPTLRLSYQARTVVHSGVGAGLGLVLGW